MVFPKTKRDEKTSVRLAELAAHREKQREHHQSLRHTPAWLKDALDKFNRLATAAQGTDNDEALIYPCRFHENRIARLMHLLENESIALAAVEPIKEMLVDYLLELPCGLAEIGERLLTVEDDTFYDVVVVTGGREVDARAEEERQSAAEAEAKDQAEPTLFPLHVALGGGHGRGRHGRGRHGRGGARRARRHCTAGRLPAAGPSCSATRGPAGPGLRGDQARARARDLIREAVGCARCRGRCAAPY